VVLVQKLLPGGVLSTRLAGAVLVICGVAIALHPL
jgi:hypothetical protein